MITASSEEAYEFFLHIFCPPMTLAVRLLHWPFCEWRSSWSPWSGRWR